MLSEQNHGNKSNVLSELVVDQTKKPSIPEARCRLGSTSKHATELTSRSVSCCTYLDPNDPCFEWKKGKPIKAQLGRTVTWIFQMWQILETWGIIAPFYSSLLLVGG